MATRSGILAWKSQGQKSLAGYSPWDRKGSDMTEETYTQSLQESGQVRVTFPRQPSRMQAAVVSVRYQPASPQVWKILMDLQRVESERQVWQLFFSNVVDGARVFSTGRLPALPTLHYCKFICFLMICSPPWSLSLGPLCKLGCGKLWHGPIEKWEGYCLGQAGLASPMPSLWTPSGLWQVLEFIATSILCSWRPSSFTLNAPMELRGPTATTDQAQFNSVSESCPVLSDTMVCSMPGLPVRHQLPEFTQTHVHWVDDSIQQSHPLSSPFLPAFNLSQHEGLFKWVSSLHQVA